MATDPGKLGDPEIFLFASGTSEIVRLFEASILETLEKPNIFISCLTFSYKEFPFFKISKYLYMKVGKSKERILVKKEGFHISVPFCAS